MVHRRGGARFVVALAATLIAVQAVAPVAAAPATTAAAFVPGSAVATSQALQIAPRDAGLAATITVGRSVAQYRNSLSQASSQALDLGLIGNSLTVQCSALPPPLTPGQLPKPITAESDTGASETDANSGGAANQFVSAVAGAAHVSATPAPDETAIARFDGGLFDLPGLVTVRGLSSSAHAHLFLGHARESDSTADVSAVELGGAVQLGGMHWTTSVRTGTKPASSSTFTVSTVRIGGTKLPTASTAALTSTISAVNKALGPTGLHVSMPQLVRDNGVLSMTPLSIGIDNSAVGKMVLVPLLNLVHTVFDPVATAVNKALCTFGSLYGAVNLIIAGLDGVGAFDLELGGTTATTNDATYSNPFGNGGNAGGGILPPSVSSAAPPPIGGGGGGAIPPLPSASVAPVPGTAPQVAVAQTVASSCSTTSPAGRPSCGRGAGLAVGLIALAALGGIAGADYFVVRRRSRLARMAIET